MEREIVFETATIEVSARKGGAYVWLDANRDAGATAFLTPSEASRLAAALNDIAARSAPVCDQAEG